jgi:Uma2 family endonuclease
MNAPFKHGWPTKAQPARFSTAQFLEMVQHDILGDRRIELVDGEIIELPPPGFKHGTLQLEIGSKLLSAVKEDGFLAGVGEVGIDLFEGTLRSCDVAIVRPPVNSTMLEPRHLVLVVEIAISTLAHDLGEKASDYAKAGIAELWVVDPDAEIIHVMREPSNDGYVRKSVVRFGEPLSVPETKKTIVIERP